nr:flocculation protein FLO11-like isoform X4 [Procambarus clarkii]
MWVRVNLVPIKDTEFAVANLIGGREYRFRVSAENAVGMSDPSPPSEVVSISTDQEATEPHFLKELRDAVAVENHRVEFSVHIIGTPLPDITWYKDGFEVYDTRRFEFRVEGDRYTLVLKEAKLTDEGDIRVRATNRVGVASSQAALTVQALPHIKLPAQYEQGLIFDTDELIRLRVPYTGRPQPQASWTHNGKQVEGDERHAMDVSDKYITLKIAGACRMDKGMYTLRLSNPQGEDSSSFFVTVTDRPDPPSVPTITDVSGTSVTLRWDPPQDDGGCRVSNYIVEYFRVGWDVWLKATASRITWTQLSDLIVGSEYRFRIKAENAYGVSEPGEESHQILIEDAKSATGSFEYETYKSTTTVGSSLPKDSATLTKGDSSSFEYGESGESSVVGSYDGGSAGKVRRVARISSDEAESSLASSSGSHEPSLDLGSSSEKPPSFDYESSRGPSFEVTSSVERGPSFEAGSSVEKRSSFEVGSSVERGPSFDVEYSRRKHDSFQTESLLEHETESLDREVSIEITSSDGRPMSYLPLGGSYELASSIDRGDSYLEERHLEVSDYIRPAASAGASLDLEGSASESLELGVSLEGEDLPTPPPRAPRRGGRSPAIPSASPAGVTEGEDSVPTPPPRARRPGSRTSTISESSAPGADDMPPYYTLGAEGGCVLTPTPPPRSRRSGSRTSLVSETSVPGADDMPPYYTLGAEGGCVLTPTPPPRRRRSGSRTSLVSETSIPGWSPTPARRRKRQKTEAAMELEEGEEDLPVAPPRTTTSSRSGSQASQASTVTSEIQREIEEPSTPPAFVSQGSTVTSETQKETEEPYTPPTFVSQRSTVTSETQRETDEPYTPPTFVSQGSTVTLETQGETEEPYTPPAFVSQRSTVTSETQRETEEPYTPPTFVSQRSTVTSETQRESEEPYTPPTFVSQRSTVTSETQREIEELATPSTAVVADFDSAQAAPDSTPLPSPSGAPSISPRMEAVTVVAGGEAVLVVSLENTQAANITW